MERKNLPKLAIVGRPNVGKSALFNRLCKKRISIVDEAEGITRDRLYALADYFGNPFEVIDTGGIDPASTANYNEEIMRQAEIAIEEADVLVLVVDGKVGLTEIDERVARLLKRAEKPVALAVNKVDDHNHGDKVHSFYGLGFDQVVGVSALHGHQVVELLDAALKKVEWSKEELEKDSRINVAVVGRPNVGKSTLVNQILSEERCIVSPEAGTTRDSVDIEIEIEGNELRLIDTAGIRKKKSEHEVVDKFAAIRTERAIERSDVCLLVVDAQAGLTAHEKRIARDIEEAGKGCILLFNKWDIVKGFRMEHCLKAVRDEVPFLGYCPAIFMSAKTGRNVDEIFPLVQEVYAAMNLRIGTGELNRFLERAMQLNHPPMITGKRLRIYYIAQVAVNPPKFVFFINRPDLMAESYKRYLINSFRKEFPFTGAPLHFHLKRKKPRAD